MQNKSILVSQTPSAAINAADITVFIGRFEPYHNAHKQTADLTLESGSHLLFLVGSAFEAPNAKNPWTYEERKKMILKTHNYDSRITVMPLRDQLYNEARWIESVQLAVKTLASDLGIERPVVAITGSSKDSSSYYLAAFPNFITNVLPLHSALNATDIRSAYFRRDAVPEMYESVLPPAVSTFLSEYRKTPMFFTILDEIEFIKNYKRQFEHLKYPPVFVTADAVVTCKGHVLMVKRNSYPGKGLDALPGGYLDQSDNSLQDTALRELEEETKLRVPPAVLSGSIKRSRVFDAPGRSLRGRVVTHAFHIELSNMELPKHRGMNRDEEIAEVIWIPFSELDSEYIFEDHWHIIQWAISSCN